MQTEGQADERDVHQELYAEKQKKKIWRLFALIFLAALIYNTKVQEHWWPDLDDGTMMFEYSDWWGFSYQKFYPIWRKESAASAEDVKCWCIRYPDGTWHLFICRVGDEGPADIFFPPKK